MLDLTIPADELGTVNINDLTLEPLPKQVDKRGYMYVVLDSAFPEYCKIGRTVDVKKRLQAYNSDKPINSARYSNISECFEDVIEVERVILEKLYSITSPTTTSREWFEIKHLQTLQELIILAENKYVCIS